MHQQPNNVLTVIADDKRCGRRQLLFGNCAFNIESIPICDVGASIYATKVALDYV